MSQDGFTDDETATPKKGLISNIFEGTRRNYEKWLKVILAIVIFEYLRLLYIDIKMIDHVLSGQEYPFRIVNVASYGDLLYLPFVFYMFYKRMRWGWITLFAAKLITTEAALLYYFNDYFPMDGANLFPYFLLATFLDIAILLFLWKPAVSGICKANDKTKWLTVVSVVILLTLLTYVGNYNYSHRKAPKSNTENQTSTAGKKQADTTSTPQPKLLALIKVTSKKPVDTTYMPTGFYFLAEKSKGIRMRLERSDTVYTVSRLPFASVENISKAKLEKSHLNDSDYTELCMTFDNKGTKDLKEGTGNPLHPKIAVIVANKLLYVVENKTSIKTGIMCVFLDGYSEQEMEAMLSSVKNKR